MRTLIVTIMAISMVFCSGLAAAEDLTGVWTTAGSNWGAASGESVHVTEQGKRWLGKNNDLTLKITEQQGDSFRGQWCSPKKCEDLVGVIRSNGEILMADEDGIFMATLIGSKMEVCYIEPGEKFRIAVCKIMEKTSTK